MAFSPNIMPGQVVDNIGLCDVFKCGPQGGMRRSNSTNTLVIVSNHVASIYDDRWDGDVLHYTGMGQTGDQSLNFMQNRTLAESGSNGVQIFLFEVHRQKEYTFCGEVKLASPPYQESQPDETGVMRKVWMFPVQLLTDNLFIDKATADEPYVQKLKQARRLGNAELLHRASRGDDRPGKRSVVSAQYNRNPWVVEYVERRAKGYCEACGVAAPFERVDGRPFLEVHHVIPLADGGADIISNAAALCPNCHRRCHHAKDKAAYSKTLQAKIGSGV